MALSAAGYVTRINNELVLLANPTAAQTDIIKDALTDLLTYIRDLCRINTTLSVSSATDDYDIPDTIDQVERIDDEDGDPIVYGIDRLQRKITLQDSEDSASAVNYTVYGTPLDIRTNYDTVIAALPESYSNALWAYIVAGCHEQAQHELADGKLKKAEFKAHNLLMYLNSEPGFLDRTIAIVDFQGSTIGDTNAGDGIDYDITEFAQTEEHDP